MKKQKSKSVGCGVCGNKITVESGDRAPECGQCGVTVCEACEAPHGEACRSESS